MMIECQYDFVCARIAFVDTCMINVVWEIRDGTSIRYNRPSQHQLRVFPIVMAGVAADKAKQSSGNTNSDGKKSSPSVPPAPSAPRTLGSFRTSQDGSSSAPNSALPKAVANQAKIVDPSGPSGRGLAFTPPSRGMPKKLNFRAKVVARTDDPP